MRSWNNLSVKEKAEMMKVAIRNGITDLHEIRQKYNEFALGGNLYDDGGPKTKLMPDGRELTRGITGTEILIPFSPPISG